VVNALTYYNAATIMSVKDLQFRPHHISMHELKLIHYMKPCATAIT